MKLRPKTDAEFMADPMLWPGLVCPVKRYVDGRLECAYLVDASPTLFHGNMWAPKPTDRMEAFPSHDAILAAGWKVD